jgi:GH15 family glucan-1,4-alpha-glucosidase
VEVATHVSPVSGYLPIADHGLIGDLHSAALVGTDGTIDWYCCPRFDAPSVFAAILDAERGGCFELAAAVPARTRQFYFPDTNLLITRFSAPSGVGEVQDFMPVATDGGNDQPHQLIRYVTCVRGSLPFRVRVAPRFGYGTIQHTVHRERSHVIFATKLLLSLRLSASAPVELDGSDATSVFTLTAGDSVVFILEQLTYEAHPGPCTLSAAERLKAATISFWRKWLAGSQYRGRWREMVHRSALTLKLLTYAPTGAIVAAPTMSLPEQLGGNALRLPLCVDPRRGILRVPPAAARVRRRGRGVHGLSAYPGGAAPRSPFRSATDYVPHRRARRPAGARAESPGGVRGLRAGAGG